MADESLRSPVSNAILTPIEFEGFTIYRDPVSGGHWLPHGELQKLAENATDRDMPPVMEINENSMQHSGRFSPESGLELVEYEFADSGVRIEQDLSTKGVWLDAGELKKIMYYVYEHTDELSEPPEDEPHHLKPSEYVLYFLYRLTERPPLY
jgi:Zn-finger nucleic acid-binding protein